VEVEDCPYTSLTSKESKEKAARNSIRKERMMKAEGDKPIQQRLTTDLKNARIE
jgi:hypothetical protein